MIRTRRDVRHSLMRARNERIAANGPHEPAAPLRLTMSPITAADIRMDSDPDELWTLDFEGRAFMGVPIVEELGLPRGEVRIAWPETAPDLVQ